MADIVSFKDRKDKIIKRDQEEFEQGTDLVTVMRHLTGKEENSQAVQDFIETGKYLRKNKKIVDEIMDAVIEGNPIM